MPTRLNYVQNIRLPTEKAHGYQIMKTCEALAKQGAEIELIVADRKNTINSDPFKYYSIDKNFGIRKLPVLDWINSFPSKALAFVLERSTFWNAIKKIKNISSGTFYTRDYWIALKLKKANPSSKVFLEIHAMPPAAKIPELKILDGILNLTKWMQTQIKRQLPSMKTEFLPDSVDLEIFDPACTKQEAREKLGLSTTAKLVVYGGRFSTMSQGKGLGFLDRACLEASKSVPGLGLILVGGDTQEFKNIEGRSPSPITVCAGSVSRDTLALYYRAADALVMPFPNTEHYAHEMSPMKLFEYMASKNPIVASDLPSLREILDDSMAWYYMPDNIEGLQEQIVQALTSQDKSRSEKAFSAVQEFTWKKRAEKILNFIK